MIIRRIEDLKDLHVLRARWDELAGDCVFRSWSWLTTWWKHYGSSSQAHQLQVLLLFESQDRKRQDDGARLIAILPCYREASLTRGNVLRLLGDGEVCSEYLDLLVSADDAPAATEFLANYLCQHATDWDLAEFTAVGANRTALTALIEHLQSQDCQVSQTDGPNCWSIELPAEWDELLARQSKSHRKQLRRLERRVLDTEQATWHLVKSQSDFDMVWPLLVDLHQRRRKSLGERGCFASDQWAAFHRDIAKQLLSEGRLRLSWLEAAGSQLAAEYHFASSRTTFAYQGGVDPDRLGEEPGRLSMIRTLQHAIAEGHTRFDLLRGDEPYKSHWRAVSAATSDYQIVPPRQTARWRYQAWSTMRRAGRLARQAANLLS